ncbi:MAG: 30S ribosomal protein S20 [Elusimicrobia bacterium]|nr:30S ribosomal protein S20 [Elusimicrobiota bacterium]
MAKLKTGRHTSALKALRQAYRRSQRNQQVRSLIRTVAKKLEIAIAKKDLATAKGLLNETFTAWDKAAKRGVIHWKAAARKKARLADKLARSAS